LLNNDSGGSEEIPAIADMAVINWSLGKKAGDIIECDGENGKRWKLRLVAGLENSLFQGSILISRNNFLKMFPDISGAKVILADAAPETLKQLIANLGRGLMPTGPQIENSALRLARYNVVQNTYLTIFLVLGGLGLVIGSAGLGVLLMRNMLERLPEFAWMRAAGFSRRDILILLLSEHLFIFISGLCCGIIGSAAAVLPLLNSPAGSPPWLGLAIFYGVMILITGAIIMLSGYCATRLNISSVLKND
jgi:ABC-type antimicrobial peptide transport system permease subunit